VAGVIGGLAARGLEKLGPFGVALMPGVGLGVGYVVRSALCSSSVWSVAFAAALAFLADMSTHVPSAYQMFHREFGAPPVRSALLSITVAIKYPVEASRQFPFYGFMLALSIVGAGWRAGS
jgi:hypothetical protein